MSLPVVQCRENLIFSFLPKFSRGSDYLESVNRSADAQKLINFFENDRDIFNNSGLGVDIVSFCAGVFNIDRLDIQELDNANNDLMSILMIISRDLNVDVAERFNKVVMTAVPFYYNWLKGVIKGMISVDDLDVLFTRDTKATTEVHTLARYELTMNYFGLNSDASGFKVNTHFDVGLVEEERKTIAVDVLIPDEEQNILCITNDMPWTDRNAIWTGDRRYLSDILNAKYRKKRDQRLIEIMRNLYSRIGDKMLFRIIEVEDKAIDKPDSFGLRLHSDDDQTILTIYKK